MSNDQFKRLMYLLNGLMLLIYNLFEHTLPMKQKAACKHVIEEVRKQSTEGI
jgi:hypothetical protein